MKKKNKPSFPEVVQIVWRDSYGVEDEWHDISYKPETRVLSTCGYKVAEDDEYIVIATTYDSTAETFGTAIAVLKVCILSSKTYIA